MGDLLRKCLLSLSGTIVISTGAMQAAKDFQKEQQLLQEMLNADRVEISRPAEEFVGTPPWWKTLNDAIADGGELISGGKSAEVRERVRNETESGSNRHYHTAQPLEETGQHNPYRTTYTLNPNNTYRSGKGVYRTNENGAIYSWSADLSGTGTSSPRNLSHQKNLQGKYEGDHAAHLIAASEGGSGKVENLVPMDAKVNTRDYRAFERENHRLLKEGYQLRLEGENFLASSKDRPEAFMVARSVYDRDGNLIDKEYFSWTNQDMSQFQENDFGFEDIPNVMDDELASHNVSREEIEQMELDDWSELSQSTPYYTHPSEEIPQEEGKTSGEVDETEEREEEKIPEESDETEEREEEKAPE